MNFDQLYDAGKYAEAVACLDADKRPVTMGTVIKYAHALEMTGRTADAYQVLRSLHDAEPQQALAEKVASAMCRLGQTDLDAIASLRSQYPASAVIQAAQSELLLMAGKWAEGFAGFKNRWAVSKGDNRRAAIQCPDWKPGEQFSGRLFVVGEQGLGEQILFSRYLKSLPPAVVLIDHRLIPLMRRTFSQHSYLDWESIPTAKEHDRAITMGDLATGPEPFVRLEPHPARAARIKADILSSFPTETVIGLSWASYRQGMADAKSIPADDLMPLVAAFPTITLQYGNPAEDLDKMDSVLAVAGLDLTNDLDGVAALADAVDVVVTCSNTVAHIAGAIGKRTILLAPRRFNLWYWGHGHRTPWYPSVEIIRADSWPEAVAATMLRLGAE